MVKTPLLSVIVNQTSTELIQFPNPAVPLSYKYSLSQGGATADTGDDVPGLQINANIIDAPPGDIRWTSLMDWRTEAHFGGNPFGIADPNNGPGGYVREAQGLDSEYGIVPEDPNVFKDSPIMSFLNISAGPTALSNTKLISRRTCSGDLTVLGRYLRRFEGLTGRGSSRR